MKPHSNSWQGRPSKGRVSLRELLECTYTNIREAARRERDLEELRDRLPVGDPRLTGTADTPPLGYQITRARLDQRHWREYQRYYLGRIALEGPEALVSILQPKTRPAPPPGQLALEEPPEREPGSDDGDEVPF